MVPYDIITLSTSQLNIPLLTAVAKLIDNDLLFPAILLFLAFMAEQGKRRNRLVLTLGVIFLLGTGVKYLAHEIRPCSTILSKVQCPSDYSFPSSHVVLAFALAAALWKKPNGWIYTIFAVFVAFTRVYLGVHTLFDVFGGMAIGILGNSVVEIAWGKIPSDFKKPVSDFLE